MSFSFSQIMKTPGVAGGVMSLASAAAIWAWRIARNRRIGAIRKKLRELGVDRRNTVRDWLKDWTSNSNEKAAQDLAANEKNFDLLVDALSSLVEESEPASQSGFISRCLTPFAAFFRMLFPFSVSSEERARLEKYAAVLITYLATFATQKRAGETVPADKGYVRLVRLLEIIPSSGEAWLGVALDPDGVPLGGKPAPAAFRKVQFYTNEKAAEKLRCRLDDLRQKLIRLPANEPIVRFHHLAVEKNVPYMVTEFAPGTTLKAWLKASNDGRVKLVNSADLMRGIVAAMASAHAEKIFHGQFNPANIRLTAAFNPDKPAENVGAKISDFCVAAIISEQQHPYIPPDSDGDGEREEDERDEDLRNAQSDVFALGVTWYQLLKNRLERPSYDFYKRLNDDCDKATRMHVEKCLVHPEDRWANAGELLAALVGSGPEVVGPEPDLIQASVPIDGYDVSDLLHDYLSTLPRPTRA